MNHPRTLPIRLLPVLDEALGSWFAALAYRLHTPLGVLLPALGLPHRTRNCQGLDDDVPTDWTVLLRASEIASISTATGVEPHVIEAMTLSRYDGNALLLNTATRQVNRWRLWGRNAGSRFCPDCLADTGGRWRLSWRLGWSFACTVHRRLLADVCPGCERVPRRHPLADLLKPGRCVEPAGPQALGVTPARCGTDLSTAITPTFPPDHPVLEAQQLLLDVIKEGKASFGVYADNPLPAAVALSDLRAVAGRILSYADRDDLNRLPVDLLATYDDARSQPPGYRQPASTATRVGTMAPARAAIAAVGATAAVMVLASDTIRTAGTALRWLVEASRSRGITVTPTTLGSWGRDTSETLKAVGISAVGPLLKPSDQLRYRVIADTPHHRLPYPRSHCRHQHIPAMFWTEWALRLRPGRGLSLSALRPALSAALLLAGTRRSLPDAAEALNAVPDAHDTSRILQRLQAHHCWPLILTALTRLADHLDGGTVPVDYHRRRQLDYDGLLPDDQWRHLCQHTGFLPGQQRRLQLARCLLFEKLSGMPADRAPTAFAVDTTYMKDRLLHFAAHLTPEVTAHLHEVAQDFLAYHGIHNEPVQWQPPTNLLDDLALPGDDPALTDVPTLHRLVHAGNSSLTDIALQLGITIDVVRHLLEHHPAPALPLTDTQARAAGHHLANARRALPKDLLIHLYVDQQLTLRAIGQSVGVNRNTIARLFDEYDIVRDGHRPLSGIVINRDWLYDQYVNHRRTLPDLAQETRMSTANMARWAKTHHIPLRRRGGGSHNQVRVTLNQAAAALRVLRPALAGHGAWERLRRFAAAAEHPTITIAAKALGLHHTALITQINRLERELGGPLLIRAERGHPMRPTPLGGKIIAAIRKYLPEEMSQV